jgi:hypothetical protein
MIEYWFDRFLLSLYVPAALALGLVASAVGSVGLEDFLDSSRYLSLLALVTLALLRLWDDLADRDRDRHDHPERVLCDADPLPYTIAAVMLAIASVGLAYAVGHSRVALELLLLYAAMGGYYLLRPPRRTAAAEALLLAKYPVLLFVLAPAPTDALALAIAMLAVYAAAIAYEIWHDAASPLRIRLL